MNFMKWFDIPNFSRYVTNELGQVKNIYTGMILKGCANPFGYFSYGMTNDSGWKTTLGRHRLLGIVFLDKPEGFDLETWEVNHLNCTPGDDWIGNLEWVTGQGNCEWAGVNGSPKCLPIQVRYADTGLVVEYPSIREASRNIPLSKDQIALRVKSDGQTIFPEGLQFRLQTSTSDWCNTKSFGRKKSIVLRHAISGEITTLPSFLDAAKFLGVSPSVVTRCVRNQALHRSLYQLKINSPKTQWRELGDITLELERAEVRRGVIAYTSGEPVYYESCIACARAHDMLPTTLNWKLVNTPINTKDIKFVYYSDTLQGSPNTE